MYPNLLQLVFMHTVQCSYIYYLVIRPVYYVHVTCYLSFTTAMADFPHARRTDVDVPGSGQDTEGDEVVGPVPLPVPSTSGTAARAAATLALQEAIMFTGSAPPSPPRPPKLVPKHQPTPPKAPPNDPLTPKTMELLRNNSGDEARWFVQYFWGLRARFRFALRNPMRNPLVTWQQGDRICRSHFVSRSEERVALILDTLNLESRPPVELSPHPRIPPPRPLPPPDADQPTLTQIDQNPSDRQHVRSLPLPVEADRTGGQSKYSLLPPVNVPHRSTPPPPRVTVQSPPVVGGQFAPRCPCLIMHYP